MNGDSVKDKSSVARPPKQRRSCVTVSSSYGLYRVEVKIETGEGDVDEAIRKASATIDNALKKRQIKQIREVKVRDRLETQRRTHREYMQRWRAREPVSRSTQQDFNRDLNRETTFDSNGGEYVFGKRIEEAQAE